MQESKTAGRRRKPLVESTDIGRGGKDEMNLAEFPNAILTNRSNDGVKTLRFRDTHGQLTVTGSDAFGLPMPVDNDVLVALIEITKKKNNFAEAKVNFTRYELIQLIGWANVGASYDRLKESLDRWAGVLLVYDGCWWDNSLKKHVSRTVHIIEDIVITEGRTKAEKDGRQQSLPLSSFSWSSHFMESFRANNLKSLDTTFYFALELPTSKQLFRFLDKRFGNAHPEWVFNLENLAFEHVGLSRKYSVAKIKEKLSGAIEELESKGFLKPLSREERYIKAAGIWKIRLVDGRTQPAITPEIPQELVISPLLTELVNRGITRATAAKLVQETSTEAITAKIEVFDWLASKQDKRIVKNPAGYLRLSIEDDYATPKGFVSAAERLKSEEAKKAKALVANEERRKKQLAEALEQKERDEANAYWEALSPTKQAELQAAADALGKPEQLALETGPLKRIGQHLRRMEYIGKLLKQQTSAKIDA